MRRSVVAPAHPTKRRSTSVACVEAIEPRVLLSGTVAPAVVPVPVGDTPPFDYFLGDAVISGTVYDDTNNNGTLEPGSDTPLDGQLVYVDLNHNGQFDASEPAGTTPFTGPNGFPGSPGSYEFSLPPGSYDIRVIPPPGASVYANSPGLATVDALQPGVNYSQADFLEGTGVRVTGSVFQDSNGNGVKDPGEVGVNNRTVFADLNNNGVPDAGDVVTTSDAAGNYSITGIPPGTFSVKMVLPAGVTQTGPATTFYTYTATGGQTITGADFGTVGPDLTVSLVSPPETFVIGGTPLKKPAQVLVTNSGNTVVHGLIGANLYLSANETLDASDFLVGRQLGKNLTLKPGQSKKIKVNYSIPPNVPSGTYHMLTQVVSSAPDTNPTNDVWVSIPTTQVMQPFINLGVQYPGYPANPQMEVYPGQSLSVPVIVTNHGNVPFNGSVTMKVYESAQPSLTVAEGDVSSPQPSLIGRLPNFRLKLLPQQTKVISVPVTFPGLARGAFYLITTLGDTNPINDIDVGDKTAIAPFFTYLR